MTEEKKEVLATESTDESMAKEIQEAKKQAKSDEANGKFVVKFKKPIEWEGKQYESLTFDWTKLTGNDFEAIEDEINADGYAVVTPEFSSRFLMGMAKRCCEEKIDIEAIKKLSIGAYSKIRSHARSFLLLSEM